MLVGQIFGSFVPFIDVRDVVGNLVNDDPKMAMFSMIGLIPAGQDAVKAIAKFADFLSEAVRGNEGVFDVVLSSDIKARSILPDGTELIPDKARIVMNTDGSIKTAYPYNSNYPTD